MNQGGLDFITIVIKVQKTVSHQKHAQEISLRQYYYQQEDENGLRQGSGYRMTNKNNPVRYVPFSSSKPKRANE